MSNNRLSKSQDIIKNKPSAEQEIDYSPKPWTLRDQIVFGVKLFVAGIIVFLLFWFFEKR